MRNTSEIHDYIYSLGVPKEILEELSQGGGCIAGGTIRNFWEERSPRDIDFFCFTKSTKNAVLDILQDKYKSEYHIIHERVGEGGNEVVKGKFRGLELDIAYYPNIFDEESMLLSADFTIGQGLFGTNGLIYTKESIRDIKDKKLIFCGTTDPLSSWCRMVRFRNDAYGFTISQKEIKKIKSLCYGIGKYVVDV